MTMVGNSATGGDGSPFLELPQRHLGPPTSQTFGPLRTAEKDLSERGEDEDPLRPDPGNLHEFQVEDNKFAFSPGQLGKLINPKNLPALKALGGIEGLEKGLRTDLRAGLSLDETILDEVVTFEEATSCSNRATFQTSASMRKATEHAAAKHSDSFKDRLRVFKENRLPEKKSKSLFELMWIALMDKVLLLLSAAALISLALGLYQTFGMKHHEGPSVDWVEGVAIIVAVVIVIVVGAGDDWQKERQFVKLNKKKEDRTVKVIRLGRSLQISVYDLMVGDICHLEPGDLIPADGVFITGYNLKCDESSATGESDQVKKYPAHLVQQAAGTTSKLDPFIISGAKVLEGVGIYVVTSVGIHSSFGKTMMALREESSTATPLQVKLRCLVDAIAKLGVAAFLLLFVVLLIRFLYSLAWKTSNLPDDYLMNILIAAVTVIVIAIPEGLPLAITLVLAFATTRMLKENNLVRVLRACETMGNATTVCTDKTGTLTQNKMTINRGINISRTEVVKGVSAFILRTAVSSTQTAKINFAADYEPASPARNLGTRERAVGLPRKSGFRGMLNGINALMLADSGSEINLITQKLALQHHLSIDKSNKYIRKVRLANGGFLQIIGRATAEWSFEDSSGFIHHITFDVAAQCTNDIIVGHNFLQETCSFEEYEWMPFPIQVRKEILYLQYMFGSTD
ncbi:calcium ATPase [Wilcoxina mikolae CBS 423.85]|nr:calcium ATPase [Wilcoxina mikolae CBS 423.85]